MSETVLLKVCSKLAAKQLDGNNTDTQLGITLTHSLINTDTQLNDIYNTDTQLNLLRIFYTHNRHFVYAKALPAQVLRLLSIG